MDTVDYANKLVAQFAVDQGDAMKMLEAEAADIREHPLLGAKRRPSYSQALDYAYERIREWLLHGDEYMVKLEWADLARFASSHRRACVWAVMSCKARVGVGKAKGG